MLSTQPLAKGRGAGPLAVRPPRTSASSAVIVVPRKSSTAEETAQQSRNQTKKKSFSQRRKDRRKGRKEERARKTRFHKTALQTFAEAFPRYAPNLEYAELCKMVYAPQRLPRFISPTMYSHARTVNAIIVRVGFWQPIETKHAPSVTNRFFTSQL